MLRDKNWKGVSHYDLYRPKNSSALLEGLCGSLNYMAKEMQILDSLEEVLDRLVRNISREAANSPGSGYAWLNRFNARNQEEFLIEFTPGDKEKAEGATYIQMAIARGNFINKIIEFRDENCPKKGDVLAEKIIPALKSIFSKMGFAVITR